MSLCIHCPLISKFIYFKYKFLLLTAKNAHNIATRYKLDGPEDRISAGTRILAPVQTVSRAHPASGKMGTDSLWVRKHQQSRVESNPVQPDS